jgi:Family of unknown function (DUF6152)
MRRLRLGWLPCWGLASVLAGGPAAAHHSFAMFDTAKQVTLDGTVKAFQWTNPHIFVELVVQGESGPESWSVEGASPNMLFRMGWTPTSIKVGDHLTIVANPLRSGDRGASFVYAKLPNGEVLGTVGYKKP